MSPSQRASQDARAKLDLPPPLPVPKQVPARIFLRNPDKLERSAKAAAGDEQWSIRQELRHALSAQLASADAQRVSSVCDPRKPWHFLALRGGVELMAAFVDEQRRSALDNWLASLPSAGNFGARKLPAKDKSKSWVIWTGPQQDRVLIAPSLRGLVTALNLRDTRNDIHADVISSGLSPARRSQMELPSTVRELHATGNLEALEVDIKVDQNLAQQLSSLPLRPGPIPGLLQDAAIVWSGSSTWTDAKSQVNRYLSRVRTLVQDLPFLIRPTAEGLEKRLVQSARQWDGRTAVALDQRQSLRLALGVSSNDKSESATLGLIQAAIPNLALMRSFSTEIPSARLVQQRARSHNQKIHELILSNIAGQLPREYHTLLSRRRELHIAMSWAPDNRALLLTAGPEAVPSMLSWIQSSHNGRALFKDNEPSALLHARTTMAASMILNWLESESSAPSLAQLLRMRSATPKQDYAVMLTKKANDLIHLDLRVEQDEMSL